MALAQIRIVYCHIIWLDGLMKAAKYLSQGNRGNSKMKDRNTKPVAEYLIKRTTMIMCRGRGGCLLQSEVH